ncbi:MAG TPA: XdhC family protein [Bacillales bacterium]
MTQSPFVAWTTSLKNEKPAVLVTLLEVPEGSGLSAGARLFVSEEGLSLGNLGTAILNNLAAKAAGEKLKQLHPKSETRSVQLSEGGEASVFIDVNIPPLELMIFGAGHDAIPVAKFAGDLGIRTVVVDPRSAFATEENFPGAEIVLARSEELRDKVHPGTRTFTVIMNHHLERDQACLRFALESFAPYVGVLGPRKRRKWLLDGLQEEGFTFSEEQLSRLYNPIGLDIGAETSEEVAISILSEILAVRNGHSGEFLRKKGRIHQPVGE